jgi:nucleotidyltransferase AbiEii toxin of type IV toxin-antitoxin system
MLKGGIAMIARLPVARHSADIDVAARRNTAADVLAALRAAADRDLGDHFTFRFDPPRTLVQGIEGVRVAAVARLGPRL